MSCSFFCIAQSFLLYFFLYRPIANYLLNGTLIRSYFSNSQVFYTADGVAATLPAWCRSFAWNFLHRCLIFSLFPPPLFISIPLSLYFPPSGLDSSSGPGPFYTAFAYLLRWKNCGATLLCPSLRKPTNWVAASRKGQSYCLHPSPLLPIFYL